MSGGTLGSRRTLPVEILKALATRDSCLKILGQGSVQTETSGGRWVLCRDGVMQNRTYKEVEVRGLLASGALEETDKGLFLSDAGRMALRRKLSGSPDFGDQHRTIARQSVGNSPGAQAGAARVNLSESPLGWLASRKDRKGRAMLDRSQVEAGERLRADYSFAQLMPSLAGGWRSEPSGLKAGGSGTGTDLRDDVMAARQRLERMLSSMDPALAAVLVDVCCHLKGLETVEAERGWPARSGKVVLQIALASLAERYGYRSVAEDSARQRRIRSFRT